MEAARDVWQSNKPQRDANVYAYDLSTFSIEYSSVLKSTEYKDDDKFSGPKEQDVQGDLFSIPKARLTADPIDVRGIAFLLSPKPLKIINESVNNNNPSFKTKTAV